MRKFRLCGLDRRTSGHFTREVQDPALDYIVQGSSGTLGLYFNSSTAARAMADAMASLADEMERAGVPTVSRAAE